MNPRTMILAVVALSLAGATALVARNWLDSQRRVVAAAPAQKAAPATEVLVAGKPLDTGSFVKADQLKWQPWPANGVAQTYAVKGKANMAAFVGSVVRQDIAPGEPVTSAKLVKPGDRGFLAAVLQPGMRAVSVPINAETGVAGLVFPGDRVDVILAQGFRPTNNENAPMRRASETVLTDLRVLAIDQRTTDKEGKPAVAKTVTLEVTPKQAEDVAVAEGLGKLSLSLRSLATENPVVASRGRGLTWDTEVSAVAGGSVGGSDQIQVVHGSKAESVPVNPTSTMPHPTPASPAAHPSPSHSGPMADAAKPLGSGYVTVAKGSASSAAFVSQVIP